VKRLKKELKAKGIDTVVAAPVYWGVNVNTASFPGSLNRRKEIVKALIFDISDSLQRWGFQHVFNMNWHSDKHHLETIVEAIVTCPPQE
jgi:creatinine amidohydrolase/Fe(II)-dependent formamide hydrolase-like protein